MKIQVSGFLTGIIAAAGMFFCVGDNPLSVLAGLVIFAAITIVGYFLTFGFED